MMGHFIKPIGCGAVKTFKKIQTNFFNQNIHKILSNLANKVISDYKLSNKKSLDYSYPSMIYFTYYHLEYVIHENQSRYLHAC